MGLQVPLQVMRSYRPAISLALTAILLLDTAGIGLGVAHSLNRTAQPSAARQIDGHATTPLIGAAAAWRHVGPASLIHALSADPFGPTVVYAATIEGALRSDDAGSHWRTIDAGLDESVPELWQVTPTGTPDLLLAAGNDGAVYRSTDGGTRWQQVGPRLDPGGVFAVTADPAHSATLLAGTSAGIWRSGDSGSHWRLAASTGGNGVDTFAWQPGTSRVYAGLVAGPNQLLVSDDGGKTWYPTTTGLDGQEGIMSLLPPGGNRSTLLAGTMGHRIWSRDVRGTWRPSSNGLPAGEHGTALAGRNNLTWTSTMSAGVFASVDGGRNWRPYGHGLAANGRVALALAATQVRLLAGTSDGIYLLDQGAATGQPSPS